MIILASASPRRKELLQLITEDFEIKVSDVDETLPEGIDPTKAVKYLSQLKASAIDFKVNDIVIGADTVVVVDGQILGKPKDEQDAFEMLSMLSGTSHHVLTGVTVLCEGKQSTFVEDSLVTFYTLSEQEIRDYIATSEPMDKAGAYGIQGKGSLLVEKIEGDYFNIVGLPIAKLSRCLNNL